MKKGFTLIELLVVVLIIGILAAVAVPQYEKAVEKSRAAGVFSNMQAIARMLDVYYLANGVYPDDTLSGVDIDLGGCTTAGGRIYCQDSWYDYNGGGIAGGGRYDTFSVLGVTRPYPGDGNWGAVSGQTTRLVDYLSHDVSGGQVTCASHVSGLCRALDFVTK